MVVDGKNVREIHKKIYSMTIKMPKMYLFMSKVADKSKKIVKKTNTKDENAEILLLLFARSHYNEGIKKLINKEVIDEAEKSKQEVIKTYVADSRTNEKWFYLASSHTDCAKDHLPYQGKLYYDDKAPKQIVKYAKHKGLHSIQWVMDGPAWFITRPNCRHFFKSLPLDIVKQYGLQELQRRYKTHRKVGDKSLATPRKIIIEEYQDRLKMLRAMYQEHPTEKLRREIQKTELLIKKHLNQL